MTGKRALVTGAGQRLGRAMSLALAGQGYDVVVHYASSKILAEETVAKIRNMGVQAEALKADLLAESETQSLVENAADALGGPISVLVNNASIFEYDTLASATRESWDRHIESNLRAPFVLTQSFAAQAPDPVLDDRSEPLAQAMILNMIDQRVQKLTPEFMSYTIAKMGLWALTQTSAQELAGRVRVNAIGPGPTVRGHKQSQDHFDAQRAGTPSGRGSNPEDIVGALAYFLGAKAVTGQLLCVDGGQHLGWKTPDILGTFRR